MDGFVSVFPNPVRDILTVVIDDTGYVQNLRSRSAPTFDVRLYSRQGNLLQQRKTKGGTVEFNVFNLPNGLYIVHVYDGINPMPVMRAVVVER